MPDNDPVLVQNMQPQLVSRKRATRIFIGRWIVDYIETFVGIATAQLAYVVLTPPQSVDALRATIISLAAPAFAAFTSSVRRSWPTIRAWLRGEEVPA